MQKSVIRDQTGADDASGSDPDHWLGLPLITEKITKCTDTDPSKCR